MCMPCSIKGNPNFTDSINSPSSHWTTNGPGADSIGRCACEAGFAGTDCEVVKCSDFLPGGSLVGLLFNSDTELIKYSRLPTVDDNQIFDMKNYLRTLLTVWIDFDGDGVISVTNAMDALRFRNIYTFGITSLPLWCSAGNCYDDNVPVSLLFRDALENFGSDKGTFDGSGSPLVTSMLSTFPNTGWDEDTCFQYNSNNRNGYNVTTDWIFDTSFANVGRVCGYVNGMLDTSFTSTDILSGRTTSFLDTIPPNSINANKRVYCISIVYCDKTQSLSNCKDITFDMPRHTDYVCSVGLFYVSSLNLMTAAIYKY